jgi:predicted NAD-dependent protein-ADP-ribosyltransferase YbiA (DUF1768 family)
MAAIALIRLFSPQSFPYGLLGNGAFIPLSIDGVNSQCVTEYVYSGMYDDTRYKTAMVGNWSRDAYGNALRAATDAITDILRASVADGLAVRFATDAAARARLIAIRTPRLVVFDDDPNAATIEAALNAVRFDPNVFHDARFGAVPLRELSDVINAVEKAMLAPFAATVSAAAEQEAYVDDLARDTYDELRRKFGGATGSMRPDVIALLNGDVNRVGAVLKRATFAALYERRVKIFRPYLLDVHLDYVLEQDYPHVAVEQYAEAKRQQRLIEGATRVDEMEATLMRLYENDELDADIADRLAYTPHAPRENAGDDEEAAMVDAVVGGEQTTYLYYADELLPWHASAIVVDGARWPTVMHYAYARAYAYIGMTDAAYVNAVIDYDALHARFQTNFVENFKHRATTRCGRAVNYKFEERDDAALIYLLGATAGAPIVWFDKTDPVLGVGADERGANVAGSLIEKQRARNEAAMTRVVLDAARFDYNLAANTFFRFWMSDLAADFRNTMRALRSSVSVRELRVVYGYVTMAPLDRTDLSVAEQIVMARAGLDEITSKYFWPFLRTDWQLELRALNEREAIERLITSRTSDRRPTADERAAADRYLKAAHAFVRSSIKSPSRFARSILGNAYVEPGQERVENDRWWRVIHWATLTMPAI